MLKYNLKHAFRILQKDKMFSALNIAGFTIGIAVCSLIAFYVLNEFSYDKYQKNFDNTYIVYSEQLLKGLGKYKCANRSHLLAETIKQNIPELKKVARVYDLGKGNSGIIIKDNYYTIDKAVYADPELFDIFSFDLIRGSFNSFTSKTNSIFISKSLAERLFKNGVNSVGSFIEFGNGSAKYMLEIAGVYNDVPVNSHLRPDAIVPINLWIEKHAPEEAWGASYMNTYVLLNSNSSKPILENKITDLLRKFDPYSKRSSYYMLPLAEVHMNKADVDFLLGEKGDIDKIYIYLAIGLLTLLIACINYINFSTAKSAMRAKEIGIRKITGAGRFTLSKQLFLEPVILAFISIPLIVLAIKLITPFSDSLFNRDLSFNLFSNWSYWGALIFVVLVVGSFSGFYSAIMISNYKPLDLLTDRNRHKSSKSLFRNILIIFQVAVFSGLIISTLVIYKQMQLIQKKDYGYNKEQVMVCAAPVEQYTVKEGEFVEAVKTVPGVIFASAATYFPPGGGVMSGNINKNNEDEGIRFSIIECDRYYKDVLGLKMAEGEYFGPPSYVISDNDVVINEKFKKELGYKNAVGKFIQYGKNSFEIKGVIKDFDMGSLYHSVEPLMILKPKYFQAKLAIKLSPGNRQNTTAMITEKWKDYFPGTVCNYSFLDQMVYEKYKEDRKFASLIGFFTVVAVLIAVIGLAGLSAYTISRKRKEIAIRKVLGATVPGIVFVLVKDMIKITLLGCILIFPVISYYMENWLRRFVYRVDISAEIFAAALTASLTVVSLSVLYHTVKTAFSNQMDSLRSE